MMDVLRSINNPFVKTTNKWLRSFSRGQKPVYFVVAVCLLCSLASYRILYWKPYQESPLVFSSTSPSSFFSSSSSASSSSSSASSPNNIVAVSPVQPPQRSEAGTDLFKPDAPFVRWPLARVCREAQWTPGLIFQCDNNSGGIGNIRSYTLTCLRYAIEAGATGLVLPRIQTRSSQDLSDLFAGSRPMSYFFDVTHFRRSLFDACPQITIFDSVYDIPHLRVRRPENVTPKLLGQRSGCDYRDLNRHTDMFRPSFHHWLASTARELNLSSVVVNPQHPRLIRFTWGVQWEWPVWKDGPEFSNTFSGLLRLRQDILLLGEAVTMAMRRLSLPSPEQRKGDVVRFAGVHLRTEQDALDFWPRFDMQASAYIDRIIQLGLGKVYLATGNATEAQKFVDKAHKATVASGKPPLVIANKAQLLTSLDDSLDLLDQLQDLTWDQQALIDYVVLLNSDYFLGVNPSSFSMTIAAKRHLAADGIYSRPWPVNDRGDGRSLLVGNYSAYWDDWLFMYDALWP